MQMPSKEARWFVLNIDERQTESEQHTGEIVRIERTNGDFCGCCGTYGRCGGPGGGGGAFACGAFAFLFGLAGAVCLLVMVLSLDSYDNDLLGESGSGSG